MRETTFYKHISKNPEKKLLFDKACEKGLIQEFDQATITNLRKLYFSCLSGLLYVYGHDTTFSTLGNKLLLLSHALENEDFELVHGETNSTREIMFFQYNQEHLDHNSWIEVKKGNKTWVYDPFSLLMFNKDVYYELENPKVGQRIPKKDIISHPSRKEDDFFQISDTWLLPEYLQRLEKKSETSPYKDLLQTEITRLKAVSNYDNIKLDIFKEMWDYNKTKK